MRPSHRRGLALISVVGLLLAGCGDSGEEPDDRAATEQPDGPTPAPDDHQAAPEDSLEDPNDDVVDGIYRGSGVVLPVPDGWALDPRAFAQGTVAAVSADGTQQMTAQAIDKEEAEAAGQPLDLEIMLDAVRQQAGQESDVDESVDVGGAERAHQLTFLQLPPPQEGLPELSVTIVIADDGDGLIGQFAYSATHEDFDQDTVSLLLDEAGFDPDSEPQPLPPPQQQPQPQPSPDS